MPSPQRSALQSSGTTANIATLLCRQRAERSILGAVLLKPSLYPRTASLRVEDFALSSHRTIYQRMRDLAETGRPVDTTTLVEELERHGELNAIGGGEAVGSLLDGVPDSPNVEHYIQIVCEAAGLRQLHGLTESIPALLKQRGSLQAVIAHIEKTRAGPRLIARHLMRGSVVPPKQTATSGSTVLNEVVSLVRRFVGLTAAQATVVALWVAHTHAFDAAEATPYLSISSAEKQSGKTRLLEVLQLLVARPWFTGRVTQAVLVRKVDMEAPTLLLDETDAAFNSDREYAEGLRGLLNTGYRRGGVVSLCVGKGAEIQPRDFQTYCPKALAGIGKLPDTVADRSIPIRLKRKAPGEGEIERFRASMVEPQAQAMQARVADWVEPRLKNLADARPALPEVLSDRQQDCSEPLVAIADLAGEDWPEQARKALVEVLRVAPAQDQSLGVKLLADIWQVFDEQDVDRFFSRELVDTLVGIETSPWAEINRGKPLTPVGLSRLLQPFDIVPRTIRVGETTGKGYLRESLEDARKRYLRPPDMPLLGVGDSEPSQTSQCNNDATAVAFMDPSQRGCVTASRIEEEPALTQVVTGVTAQAHGGSTPAILKGEL